MTKFSVNISTIYTEVPFLERFKKAKEAGFSYIECQFPYLHSIEEIQEKLHIYDQLLVLMNFPAGNWDAGERGFAANENRIDEFRESVDVGIRYAVGLGCKQIHCMAGIVDSTTSKDEARACYVKNVAYAASKAAAAGITILIEPINTLDIPNYFLNSVEDAVSLLAEINATNVKLQYDFYHRQRSGGNLLETFQNYASIIEHVQIADVPGRHQPGTGEINYNYIFEQLKEAGYDGFVGLEYFPKGASEESFEWIKEVSSR